VELQREDIRCKDAFILASAYQALEGRRQACDDLIWQALRSV
jgi:hypothetical protein